MKFPQAIATLAFALSTGTATMIWGAPGIGKSDMVAQAVRAAGRPFVPENFATCEAVDIRGLPRIDPTTGAVEWCAPDFVHKLRTAGPRPVLFIDEANTNAAVLTTLMQITLENRAGPHALPEGTSVILAGNRQSDRAAAHRMPTALANRLLHIDVEVDVKAWVQWAAAENLHPALVAFIMLRGEGMVGKPGILHSFDPAKPDVRAFPSPRSWHKVSAWIDAPDSIRYAAIAGIVGEGAAAELEGFLRVYRGLPPLPQIIGAPDAAPVPADVSTQYAVTIALSRASNGANFSNVIRYLGRIGREFEIMGVSDAIRRHPELASTGAYIHFAARNSDVMI